MERTEEMMNKMEDKLVEIINDSNKPMEGATLREAIILSSFAADVIKANEEIPMGVVAVDINGHAHYMDISTAPNKNLAASSARILALKTDAQAMLMVCEAWSLSLPKNEEEPPKVTGSLENHPDAFECVMIQVETHTDAWMALAKINKRIENGIEQRYFDEQFKFNHVDSDKSTGRFAKLIPPVLERDLFNAFAEIAKKLGKEPEEMLFGMKIELNKVQDDEEVNPSQMAPGSDSVH